MTKDEYATYLQSDHWQALRKRVLASIPKCERCSVPRWLAEICYGQDLHLHHKTYANLGSENEGDLEVLCRRCHDIETYGRTDLRELRSYKCIICDRVHWDPRADCCHFCDTLAETPLLHQIADAHSMFMEDGSLDDTGSYLLEMIEIMQLAVDMRRKEEKERHGQN